jgi:hypothetical protein
LIGKITKLGGVAKVVEPLPSKREVRGLEFKSNTTKKEKKIHTCWNNWKISDLILSCEGSHSMDILEVA